MYLASALKIAIERAIEDRKDFAAAYGHEGPEAEGAVAAVARLRALKGVKPAKMNLEQLETAREALVWAEQRLAEVVSCECEPEARKAYKKLHQIRTVRRAIWGKTNMEAFMASAVSVDIREVADLLGAGRTKESLTK